MHISCIFVHIRRTKFMYISFPSLSTIYVKTIKEAVYWWDAFLSTVIKRKDYTYAASSPQPTSFIKAIVGNSILMGLMFLKRFTNGHHLLSAETRLSPSTYYFGKIYQRSSILMGHLHIYSYKKEGLYLCSDIRSRGAKKYSPSFLTRL